MALKELQTEMRSDEFRDFVLDQLSDVDGVKCRRMFGAYGLYAGPTFFGIVHRGQLFFKTSDRTRAKYVGRGSSAFKPSANQTLRSYYELPAEVIEERRELAEWAREAIGVGRRADRKKSPR